MQSTNKQDSNWDFSPVFDLLKSLRSQDEAPGQRQNEPPLITRDSPPDEDAELQLKGGLGDFNRLWDYLGVQRGASIPSAPPFEASTAESSRGYDAYASDGALYYPPSAKSERQTAADRGDLTDSPDGQPSDADNLTKNQRKKRNRKLRRAEEASKVQRDAMNVMHRLISQPATSQIPPYVTEDSKGVKKKQVAVVSSSDVTSAQTLAVPPKGTAKFERDHKEKPVVATTKKQATEPVHSQRQGTGSVLHSFTTPQKATPTAIDEARNKVAAAYKTAQNGNDQSTPRSTQVVHESLQQPWKSQNFAAARLQPIVSPSAFATPTNQYKIPGAPGTAAIHFPTIQQQAQPRLRHEILPLVSQTSVDRNWALLLKLLHNFPEDRKHLVSPLQLSINRPQPEGIHVFVDASNIMIGFYDHLKTARGIPSHARVPRVDLNFHALALLLERRRPVAKRVLAGSSPEIQAFEEARQVGYETCILDKVWKARELTEKQKRYQTRDGYASANGYVSGSDGAGNGTFSQQQPKWVEQAVDEILHLKILESVVDHPISADAVTPMSMSDSNGHLNPFMPDSTVAPTARSPARPTMVLATGDAAEAEYSAGFRKMVERALKSGWMVEVMAFGKNISMDYRKMERLPLAKGGWGERFKIIELDEYAEELFGEGL